MTLCIAQGLSLPINAVTEKLGFIGRTGSGKTYAAQRLAEEMHRAGAQFVALDPVGKWWSLRLAADGKSPSIPVPVFGGLHGDVPLEPTAGKLVADVIVDRGIPAVVDVSQFESDAAKARFMTDFGNRFFFRKKAAAPSAVHIFMEECQEFVPQNPQRDEAQMLHAWTRIQKLGRNYGIGSSLISQRPQEVNKKVLNQVECLFVFQLTGPHERKTVAWWIQEKGIDEDIAAELAKLERGCPHVWSPAWLKVSKVVRITEKTTFDASSTPKVGQRADVKELAPIDLEKLRHDMTATIERAKAEDPRELRRRIAELEKDLRKSRAAAPAIGPDEVERIYRDTAKQVKASFRPLLKRMLDFLSPIQSTVPNLLTTISAAMDEAQPLKHPGLQKRDKSCEKYATKNPLEKHRAPEPPRHRTSSFPPSSEGEKQEASLGNSGLRRMLIALAQRNGLTAKQLGVRAGMSSKSGTFSNYLGKARSTDWIRGSRDRLEITETGRAALGSYDPLPEGEELLSYWLGELGNSGANRMLSALAERYPKSMTAEELGEASNISAASGTFSNYLGRLRTLELVTGSRHDLRASEELFG